MCEPKGVTVHRLRTAGLQGGWDSHPPVCDPLWIDIWWLRHIASWVLAQVLRGDGLAVQLHTFQVQQMDSGLGGSIQS